MIQSCVCVVLRRSQETDWSRYDGDGPPLFVYDFKTGQVFDVSQLCTNKRSRRGSGVIVDISGQQDRFTQDIQLASITSFKCERLEVRGASGLGDGPDAGMLDPPV